MTKFNMVRAGSDTISLTFTIQDTGSYRFVVLAGGSTAPTSTEVLAGTGAAGSTPIHASSLTASVAGRIYSEVVPLLVPLTTYDIYLAVIDTGLTETIIEEIGVITTLDLYSSYITLQEADRYMTTRLYSVKWDDASDNDKSGALVMATRELDAMAWKGSRVSSAQVLSWPRTGVFNPDGIELRSTVIPAFLQHATAELALSLLQEDRWAEKDNTGVSQVTTGPVTVKFDRHDALTRNNFTVIRMIGFYVTGSGVGSFTTLTRA